MKKIIFIILLTNIGLSYQNTHSAAADNNNFLTYLQKLHAKIKRWQNDISKVTTTDIEDTIINLQQRLAIEGTKKYEEMTDTERIEFWRIKIIKRPFFISRISSGYIFIGAPSETMSGPSKKSRNPDNLIRKYKIHLMPTYATMPKVVTQLLHLIKTNEEIHPLIHGLKISPSLNVIANKTEVMPRIVIYAADGKKNAQDLLNIIYNEFKNVPGVDIRPRYNVKVTSLIYAAQGDGGLKKLPAYAQLYDTEHDKAYFNAATVPPEPGYEDHYLRHPETGAPLFDTPLNAIHPFEKE